MAASGPLVSRPAMGWPGTNCATLPPRARRAAATTSDLVLPASVTTVPACRCGANADSIASACATGAASNTRSAPLIASAISSPMMSMMPSSRARASDAAERSMPTTLPTAPAFFSARANEPPIKPTPKITTLFSMPLPFPLSCPLHRRSLGQRLGQRRDQHRVLPRQADGDAQPFRQAVVTDRTHDHALLQQGQVDARAGTNVVADLDQHEVT